MIAHRPAQALCGVACWALGSCLFVSSAAAQATSGINGKVTDSTSGALPGVTVTISSPALQVPSITAISAADGTYRFLDLPAGTYEARYELAGFRVSVRTGIALTVGFTATINVALEIGGLQESVTVSGASPVVDVTNTKVLSTLSIEQMSTIPNGRRPADIAMMTPGMMLNTIPNSSSLGQGSFANSVTSGGVSNYIIATDGVEHNNGGIRSPDLANVLEVNVTQSGGTADVAQSGTYVNVVSKSGGNEFHGRYAGIFAHHSLEASNLDAALIAQNLTSLNTTRYFNDVNGDLGGRIIRDRLWFYGSIRERHNRVGLPGFVLNAGPDGKYQTGDEPPYLPTASNRILTGKLSYQATNRYQYSGYWQREVDVDHGVFSALGATRFVPYEASGILNYDPRVAKIEMKGTPSNRFLFTGMFSRDWAPGLVYSGQPGQREQPAARDLATSMRTGSWYPEDVRTRSKWQSRADVTYVPSSFLGGNHELRTGWRFWRGAIDTSHFDHPGGNYILNFDTVGGVPHQPSQLVTYNSPVTPSSNSTGYSVYFTDRWAKGSRLTLNLGFRWDRYHAWVPEQTKVQGTFGTAGTFPLVEAGIWNRPAPRAGFAYNLTGDAKTVVKGTYGWFNDELNEGTFPQAYNKNTDEIVTYRWHDLNHNNNYDPGEVDLRLAPPDFLSITGAANNIVNLDLKHPHTHELTGSFERELASGMGFRALYTWRRLVDGTATINALRPYSAFNIPVVRRDPGADGNLNTTDDGPLVTLYDFPSSVAGGAFVGNKRVTRDGSKDDRFQALELTLNKRSSARWDATASASVIKNHRWITSISQSPNEDFFPLDETWQWTYRTTASYTFPLDIRVSSLVFLQSGTLGQRTYLFRTADPTPGGTQTIRNAGNLTVRLEPFGASQGPMRKQVNLRASKILKFAGARRVELNVDVNNLINSNAAWTTDYTSGPTFGYAQTIVPPRLVQFGAGFTF